MGYSLSSREKLRRLAEPLEPARAPFYVRRHSLTFALRRHFPAEGWYWTPKGSAVAVWLAQTYEEAAWALREENARAMADLERRDRVAG